MSTLLWATVPGGMVGTGAARQAVLRVLVTPRLDGGTLKSNDMDPWPPTKLMSATLVVDFAASPNAAVQQVQLMPPHIRPQPEVWGAFFPSDTTIRPPAAHSDAAPQVVVEPTSATARTIGTTLASTAGQRLRLDHDDDRKALDNAARNQLATNWTAPAAPGRAPRSTAPDPGFQPPELHQTIAKLREHPAVLRALGLIIELTIPAAALTLQSGVVRVRWPAAPTDAPTLPTIASPWTQFDEHMLPAATANISVGMVTLSNDRWQIVNVDVDTSARRLRNAAQTNAAGANAASFPLPALRAAGLMLVRPGRQSEFGARRQIASANARRASMDAAVLTADDLVLGYRIDVKRQDQVWASLNARDAVYTVQSMVTAGATPITIGGGPAREEGHVKPFAAVDDGSGELRADEVVTRWTGWSLAAPLPAARQDSPVHPGMPFAFDWNFHVPKGTLPPLRFSKSYTLRARVADLAGGGLDVADSADTHFVIGPAIYQRYEPVASPQLTLPQGLDATALGAGESIAQVVMREDGGAGTGNAPSRTRVLAAPREPLRLAEQHGVLDGTRTPEQIVDLVRQAIAAGPPLSGNDVLFADVAADGVCACPRAPGGLDVARTDQAWNGTWPDLAPKEVVLRERGAGDSILAWETTVPGVDNGDRLVVRLAKAEELTLELSSTVKDRYLPDFAVTAVPGFAGDSRASAIAGRHPMITPVRAVTFTYAVRRPLADPAGTLTAQRAEGQTFALLMPAPAVLGIDVASSGKLELDATWTEPNGSNDTSTTFSAVPVETLIINRGDQTFKQIRHELGDTRHRRIVSRFRRFYAPGEDDAAFAARATLAGPVVIPSSARPPRLTIVSTRPAFKWQDTLDPMPAFRLVRRRLGGYLRLELGGPWYQTGEGERLAAIVGTNNNPPAQMWPLLTQVGLDPIREPAGPPPVRLPTAEAFAETADAARAVVDRDSNMTVMAVPFAPWFGDGRWFADIALPDVAAGTFWPFVQLAVARYQPDSVAGLELSPIARTEMVQLTPPRTLTVRRTGNDVFVSLDGPVSGPGDDFSTFEVFLERLELPPGGSADAIDLSAVDQSSDTPAWIADGSPLGGSLGTREFHFVVRPGGGPARLRIEEGSVRNEYSDVVLLPEP